MFFRSKKGTMTNHIKYHIYYIGVNLINRLGLHQIKVGERLRQVAKKEDFIFLTRIASGARLFFDLDRGLGDVL